MEEDGLAGALQEKPFSFASEVGSLAGLPFGFVAV